MKRWFYHDWLRIETRLRTSIVEGISVFLSLFDDNPAVKRIFCPPKETYDPVAKHGRPLRPAAAAVRRTDRTGHRLRAQLPGVGQSRVSRRRSAP